MNKHDLIYKEQKGQSRLKSEHVKWIGVPLKRREDSKFIQGKANYLDDLRIPGIVHCKILRSPHAHALIKRIDKGRAEKVEGVLMIVTGKEIDKDSRSWSGIWQVVNGKNSSEKCLAIEKVRYVGEPVAAVVATDKYIAEDALDLIEVDYAPLPPVVDALKAMEKNSALVHDEWGDNIEAIHNIIGGDVDKGFRESDLTLEERFVSQRTLGSPMETCGAMAQFDRASENLTIWSSTQWPHVLKTVLAYCLDIPESNVRCIAPDVGGGFGIKLCIFPHEILVSILAMKLGVPVKYCEDRQEHLIASKHAYERVCDVKIGAKKDGRIVAWKERIVQDEGAYPAWGILTISAIYTFQPAVYKFPNVLFEGYGVCTNKCSVGAFRGVGTPQMNYVREVMIDKLARKLGMDRAEIRLKNMIKRDDFPYRLATGTELDTGSFEECFMKVLDLLDYRKIKLRKDPFVGIGFSMGIDTTSGRCPPAQSLSDYESAILRVEPGGNTITALVSSTPQGQGHDTVLAQIIADEFGIDISRVRVIYGDTDKCPAGMGTMASRTIGIEGSAIVLASRQIKDKILKIAAHKLEARIEDLVYLDGKVTVKGSPTIAFTLEDAAHIAWGNTIELPEGMSPGLHALCSFEPPNTGKYDDKGIGNIAPTYPNGVDGVVVRVDPETGRYQILKYAMAYDCGTLINPMLVEGQLQGGLCQGLGIAALEDFRYDENGQPMTSTLSDYLLPTANEMPMVTSNHIALVETPSPNTLTGAKGVGEIPVTNAAAALSCALADAIGVDSITELPLSPEKIHRIIMKITMSK